MPETPIQLPTLDAVNAIELALLHLDSEGSSAVQRHLLDIRWSNHAGKQQWSWILRWYTETELQSQLDSPNQRGGGHLEVFVDNQNTVTSQLVR